MLLPLSGDPFVETDAAEVCLAQWQERTLLKAKLVGRWVERSEQKNSNVNYVMSDQPMTEEEWAAERVTEH